MFFHCNLFSSCSQWAVLTCGHCFCSDCIAIIIEQYSTGVRRSSVKCAICRQTTTHKEISYVFTNEATNKEDEFPIKVSNFDPTKSPTNCKVLLTSSLKSVLLAWIYIYNFPSQIWVILLPHWSEQTRYWVEAPSQQSGPGVWLLRTPQLFTKTPLWAGCLELPRAARKRSACPSASLCVLKENVNLLPF